MNLADNKIRNNTHFFQFISKRCITHAVPFPQASVIEVAFQLSYSHSVSLSCGQRHSIRAKIKWQTCRNLVIRLFCRCYRIRNVFSAFVEAHLYSNFNPFMQTYWFNSFYILCTMGNIKVKTCFLSSWKQIIKKIQ